MLPWWSSDYFILFFSGVRKFRVRREWYSTRKYLCLVITPTLFSTCMLIHTDTHTFQIHSNCKDPWHVFHIMFLIAEQKTNSILKSYKLFSSSIILIWVSLTLTQKVEGQDDNHSHYKYIVRVFKIMICEANLLSTYQPWGQRKSGMFILLTAFSMQCRSGMFPLSVSVSILVLCSVGFTDSVSHMLNVGNNFHQLKLKTLNNRHWV